jgi:ankyrin repeat protein
MRRLLEAGADPNGQLQDGTGILHLAAMRGDPGMVRMLLDSGANPNAEDELGQTPLFYLEPGGAGVLQVLLDAGADVDHQAKFGKTPMMSLVATGQFQSIFVLLSAGADWSVKSRSGDSLPSMLRRIEPTLDHSASQYVWFLKVHEFLVSKGADLQGR